MRLIGTVALILVLLTSSAHARGLQQKNQKPVVCDNAPPTLDHNTWPSDCKDMPQGFACKGTCEKGFTGSPTAVCQGKKGGWAANGGCKPAKCDAADLPKVANATWASCDKAEVGSTCTATCNGYFTESGPITVTCEGKTKGAEWSQTEAYCGTINTQALLTIQASAPGGTCDPAAANAVKKSVEAFMAAQQTGVNELSVAVYCYNADGTTGTNARRLLQESQVGPVRYLVVVIYVGPEAAAMNLVDAAETDLNKVGELIANVAAATNNQITVSQEGTTGDYSGGGSIPLNPQQDAKVSLLHSSPDEVQTNTSFFLTAVYTGTTGFAQAGVQLTGPVIVPEAAVTCAPVAPAPKTDALGTATWSCATGATGVEDVTITVEAPNPSAGTTVSASVSLTIGTDCVGDWGQWGECTNVCGEGQQTRLFEITTPATHGGRACQFQAGANQTRACTGATVCGECQECGINACVNRAAGYTCSNNGKCYDGTCQAESQVFAIKSITPPGTIPATNSEWFWGRLYSPGSVVGQIVPLAGESGRTVPTSPANVTEAIVTEAPEDPRASGTQLTTALHMLNPTSSDRVEAQVWYRNNTPEHPPGVFNGMKFRDFINSNGSISMSWYRGSWPGMTVGSAPALRFTIINPALLPFAAGGGYKSRIEFVWDPAYDYGNNVPTNTWRTDVIDLNKGKLFAYLGGYATVPFGAKQIDCYQPLSWWMNPASTCTVAGVKKQHPWFNPAFAMDMYGTNDIFSDGIIWEVRVHALNPKSLTYVNNVRIATSDRHFTYVFTN